MDRAPLDLDVVAIASPCSQSWDDMTGDDRVRHCAACALNVYDVAAMTRDEATELIRSTEGRLCVRLHRRADGRLITRDCPVGVRLLRSRRMKRAAAVVAVVVVLGGVVLLRGDRGGGGVGDRIVRAWRDPGDTLAHALNLPSLCSCVGVVTGSMCVFPVGGEGEEEEGENGEGEGE